MFKIFRFFITVIQVVLLFDSTNQSRVKQTMAVVKTLGKTIKSPMMKTFSNNMKKSIGILQRNKNTMKNVAYGFKEKQLIPKHSFVVKQLGGSTIKSVKSTSPLAFGSMVKKSAEFMRGKDLSSLISMVSNSKAMLPFLAGSGLMGVTQMGLVPEAHDVGRKVLQEEVIESDEIVVDETEIKYGNAQPEYRTDLDERNYFEKSKITLCYGTIYEGDLKQGEMHGQGRLTYRNPANHEHERGDEYEGDFVHAKLQGLGRVKYINGDLYEGYFADSKPNGDGRQIKKNKDKYVGRFALGLPEGKGEWNMANGDVYKGIHTKGKIEGEGCMNYNNGDVHTGGWKDNLRHGYGQFASKADSKVQSGYWFKDKHYQSKTDFNELVEKQKLEPFVDHAAIELQKKKDDSFKNYWKKQN